MDVYITAMLTSTAGVNISSTSIWNLDLWNKAYITHLTVATTLKAERHFRTKLY